eukprot:scaffold4786_cov65-Phaeocystis_antarctica.AAC.4
MLDEHAHHLAVADGGGQVERLASGAAPAASSSCTTSAWPSVHACISGVKPCASDQSTASGYVSGHMLCRVARSAAACPCSACCTSFRSSSALLASAS